MADRYDDMLAAQDAQTQRAAAQQIADHYKQNAELWKAAYDEGRHDDCVMHWRNAKALEAEAREILGTAQAQQQQPQPQQQLSEAERELLRDYPQTAADPAKLRTALIAANNLIMRGYSRDSSEYISTIAHACGVLNSDMTESLEVASPNTALAACQSKYGPVTVEEYNQGVLRLAEDKKRGMRPMSQG